MTQTHRVGTPGSGSSEGEKPAAAPRSLDFIRTIITEDQKAGKNNGRVHTRFPPEPNGYLHIGHAKSICLNFGIARDFGGLCNLRFDDTNPTKEEQEYVDSIIEDVRWLGFDWGDRLYFASDYFDQMHQYAVELINSGKAYVCDLSLEQVRQYRGTLTRAGKESPYRNRPVDENLDLFERMRKGEFPDGSRTLRAKIDMAHANMNLRDPIMYRILHAHHHRSGNKWCVYPMYDWAHGIEDSLEGITHSICTLEFEDHRPLYDWFIDAINEGRGPGKRFGEKIHHPRQIEFARLELTYTLMSKRKLLDLVKERLVSGWDDPRMPTISGMRRRGYPPEAIRNFCDTIGVAKFNSTIDFALLEHHIREELNKTAPRVMGVLRPLKVVITNYPEGQVEELDAVNNPEDPSAGTRKVPFSRILYIEQDDFREDPPKQFFRLAPGREVRLRYAYFITCRHLIKDPDTGEVVELQCTYDPATKGGDSPDGRKVKATLHWVSAAHAIPAEVRLYDQLFVSKDPESHEATEPRSHEGMEARPKEQSGTSVGGTVERRDQGTEGRGDAQTSPLSKGGLRGVPVSASGGPETEGTNPVEGDWRANLNPNSLTVLQKAMVEPSLQTAVAGNRFQFERQGYFCVDPDSTRDRLVFNRTATLKDTWAKVEAKTKEAR